MTDFNLETECREARSRLHRSIGQLSRQAKVRCLANCDKVFNPMLMRYIGKRRVPKFTRATVMTLVPDWDEVLRYEVAGKR